jgi:hypothetical protein
MNQPNQAFAYSELRSLSFIELFHLCVAIARRRWFRDRKLETDRKLWPQAERDDAR